MDGGIFLAGRARHNRHAGAEQIITDHMQRRFAAAKQGGEKTAHFFVDGIEGGFEALFGFLVDLGDGFFQQGDGGLDVFALAAVVVVALAGFGKFVERGEIDGAECADAVVQALDLLRQIFQAACVFQAAFALELGGKLVETGFAGGERVVKMLGVEQGFLLFEQGVLRGGLPLRLAGGQVLQSLILRLPLGTGGGERGGGSLNLIVERGHRLAQLFQTQILLALVRLFGADQLQLALALLPVGLLRFQRGDALAQALLLLAAAVDGDFSGAVAAVGFQQRQLRLFQRLLLPAVDGFGFDAARVQRFGGLGQQRGIVFQRGGGVGQLFGFLRQLRQFLPNMLAAQLALVGARQHFAGSLAGAVEFGGQAALLGLGAALFGIQRFILLRQALGALGSSLKSGRGFGQQAVEFGQAALLAHQPLGISGVVQQHADAVDLVAFGRQPAFAGLQTVALGQRVIQIGGAQYARQPMV